MPLLDFALPLLAMCGVNSAASLPPSEVVAPPPEAVAPAGTFVGFLQNGTKIWRGIPYAEPPVKDLRWMKTVKKARIEGKLEAKSFGASCAQLGPAWPSLGGTGGAKVPCQNPMMGCPNLTWSNLTSEDCLFLNVYAPGTTATDQPGVDAAFPVVVYFPAGAFEWGSSDDAENNGWRKSLTPGWKDTVLVTANYRDGILGFLASESLSKRSGDNSSGLFGVHDQTTVLQWVQENIAAFGGDPKRVMIFGESAGATSMTLHLVMPESAGLYHAVAIDSGAFNQWAYRSWDDAIDIWDNITKALGCDAWAEPLDCMLTKPTKELLTVSDAYYGNMTGRSLPHPEAINGTQWGPVVDGVLLPQSPMELLYEGQDLPNPKVPILMGSNSDEGTTFLSQSMASSSELEAWCNTTFGPTVGKTVSDYYGKIGLAGAFGEITPRNPSSAREVWDDAAQAVIGDFVMWCPARSAAEHLTKVGHKVFLYDFVHQPAVSVNWPTGTENLGAFHGAEVPFVYGDTFELVGGEVTLSQVMSQFWTNMASSGDPNKWAGPKAPQWTPPTVASLPEKKSNRRALQPADRPPTWIFWWHMEGATCGKSGPKGKACGADKTGKEEQLKACKQACMADQTCGGFEQTKVNKGTHSVYEATLKGVDCAMEVVHTYDPSMELFLLRPKPQPKQVPQAPNVELPWNCSTFSRGQACYNLSDTYKTISINITSAFASHGRTNKYHHTPAPDLAKCCAACSADSQCKLWFVPSESNGTECRLVYKDNVEGFKQPSKDEHCISGSAPSWTPPAQCHDMFAPLQRGLRVNASQSPEKRHWGGKVKTTFLEGQTLGSCCNACYMDYQSESPCEVWAMPIPSNGTCIMYGGYGVHIYYAGPDAARPDTTFKGASKFNPPRPPPPPPPAPCVGKQPTVTWPEWSVANDAGVQFDVCNITIQPEIKKTRCEFWHETVDTYWDIEKWIPADPENALRKKVRSIFRQHLAARGSRRKH
jgi:para-nitrobenzyl esterase